MHIEGFLEALTNTNKDGRIVVNKQGKFRKVKKTRIKLENDLHRGLTSWHYSRFRTSQQVESEIFAA